jgi:hypothetical protein
VVDRLWQACKGWTLWQLPKPLITYVLTVNALAAAITVVVVILVPFEVDDLRLFAVLVLCAWVTIELTKHIERKREYSRHRSAAYVDTKAAWSFAALIVLPLPLAAAMVVLSYCLWARAYPISSRGLVHRWVFSNATVLLGAHAAAFILAHGMSSYPGAPAATPRRIVVKAS